MGRVVANHELVLGLSDFGGPHQKWPRNFDRVLWPGRRDGRIAHDEASGRDRG